MRIVDRKTFLKMPAGTAFQKGERWVWSGLAFKTDDAYENDWRYISIDDIDADSSTEMVDRLEDMKDTGRSYPIGFSSTRDGCFDDSDLFLIYEPDDLVALRAYIDAAVGLK